MINAGTVGNKVIFTDAGTLNLGGNFVITGTAMTLTPSTGAVNYNKAGDQTVAALSYYNLIFSGSGAKSMVTGTSVAGNLSIWPAGNPTASIGTDLDLAVNSLTLGGVPQSAGTYGSTSSTAANQNDTCFAPTTGMLTVTADAPPVLLTRTAGASPSIYGDALAFHAVVSPDPGDGSTVTFYANGVALGTATTTGGAADLSPALNALKYSGGSPAVVTASCAGSPATSGTLSGGQQVEQKTLTVSSPTAQSKYYDGTTTATVGGTLVGVVSGDSVTLNGSFADPIIGVNKPVTFALVQSGANYTLTEPVGITADIMNNTTAWINPVGGSWDTATNWQDGDIARTANIEAHFDTLDITSDTTVSLNSPRTIGNLIFGDTDPSSAAGWTLDNGGSAANTLTLAGTGPGIAVNALGTGKSATISASIEGTSGLTKTGNGTLTLGATNNYAGGTALGAGTLVLGANTALPVGTSVTLGGSGTAATLDLAGYSPTIAGLSVGSGAAPASQIIGSSSTSANSTLTVSGTSTFGGIIQDTLDAGNQKVALEVTGGTVTLSGANTYSGGTTLSAGLLDVKSATALGAGTFSIKGGTLKNTSGGALVFANAMTWNAGFASDLGNSLTFGPVTMNADSAVNIIGAGNLTVGPIAGSGSLAKSGGGAGKLVLNGANTYAGNTLISGGILKLALESSISSPKITIASGAGFDVSSLATGLALGDGQTLETSATGTNPTATITTLLDKGLTLSAGGLAFTAYGGGATAPLTVAGATAGTLNMNGAPVSIPAALAEGTYKLIARSGLALVTGTPGALSVAGAPAPVTHTLAVTGNELILTVTAPLVPPTPELVSFTMADRTTPTLEWKTAAPFQYRVLYSDRVNTPLSGWSPLTNALEGFIGPDGWRTSGGATNMTITDTNSPLPPARFYLIEAK